MRVVNSFDIAHIAKKISKPKPGHFLVSIYFITKTQFNELILHGFDVHITSWYNNKLEENGDIVIWIKDRAELNYLKLLPLAEKIYDIKAITE